MSVGGKGKTSPVKIPKNLPWLNANQRLSFLSNTNKLEVKQRIL